MTAVRLPAAERRRQLLDHALSVFSERGFHGASMNDVADAAGVTKPVLYQHFPSKRDLYLELLRDVGDQLTEAITAASVAAEGDARSATVGGLAAYFRFVQNQQSAFKLLFGSGGRRDEGFTAAIREVEDLIADTIAGRLDPELPPAQRRVVAHGIVGMAEGTCRHWLASGADLDPDELAEQVGDLLHAGLQGLRAHTPV